MKHVVQLLLPLYDNAGQPLPHALFDAVRRELVGRFGGLTAYTRAPAKGLWQQDGGATVRDDIVVYEVMAETLDEAWWRGYREALERRFAQQSLVVRATPVVVL
jgi:hypothetical protein